MKLFWDEMILNFVTLSSTAYYSNEELSLLLTKAPMKNERTAKCIIGLHEFAISCLSEISGALFTDTL